jgi:cobalt-zinc-cadmium efflux system membrane fusion protein
MNHHKLKNIFLAVSTFLLIFSCVKGPAEETTIEEHHEDEETVVELTDAQIKTAGVLLGSIEQKQISGTVRVNGVLDVPPQQLVSVSAPLGGFLKATSLLEGSRVRNGQVIATVENLDFIQIQQDYLEAKGNFESAKADYKRQQTLATENVNSEKTLQQAKTNFTTWQAKYNGLRAKLNVLNLNIGSIEEGNIKSSINLYSPINGYVTEVNVNVGKFVSPTDVLFEIVDTEHLHAELIVFEKDVRKLKLGQKVRFTLANETKERMATVYLIGREIGKDRTIQIHCHIDEEDKELLPGMYLNAVVETGGAQVAALPDDAIIDYQGKKYIFILLEGAGATEGGPHTEGSPQRQTEDTQKEREHFKMTAIETGHSELGYTEVVSTEILKLGEAKIVIEGAYSLLSKMKNSGEEGEDAH